MIETIGFARTKLNQDDDIDFMPLGDSKDRLDIVYPNGSMDVLESRRALTLIAKTLPSGTNKCIGTCLDTENNAIIYALYNSNNLHSIIRFNANNTFENISYGETGWGFSADYPMTKMFVIGTGNDALLFMNDNYNPPRLVNLYNLQNNLYPNLTIAEISLYKPAPIRKPNAFAYELPNLTKNNIAGKLFQFKYGYVFDTGQRSMPSHCSDVIYDYSNETVAGNFDVHTDFGVSSTKNVIIIDLYRDYANVEKLELYVRVCDIGSGASGSWRLYDTIEVDDPTYTYYFYNDKQTTSPIVPANLNDDEVPIKSGVAEMVDNRIVLGQNNVGRDNVDIDIELALQRSSLNANPGISYETSYPYQSITDVDIGASGGNLISVNVVIAKVINNITTTEHVANPVIESYENYYYTYNSFTSVNTAIIDYFVQAINEGTAYTDIVASKVLTGGSPCLLRLTNNNAVPNDIAYYAYTFISGILPKTTSFKENSTQNLAICYYDSYNRSGRALIKNMAVKIHPFTANNYDGYYTNYVKYTINHTPPSWATCYQFLRAESDVVNHFTVPILIKAYYGETPDIVEDGMTTKVDLDAAIDRFHETNEFSTLNNFTVQKGDRCRVIGYIYNAQAVHLAENIDVPVLDIDEDGKIVLPSFGSYDEHAYWMDEVAWSIPRPIYLFEFYRPASDIEAENLYYYEIGDLLSITGGYHMASTVTGSEVTKQDQTDSVPAIGVINFGDTYRFYYHFGARFVNAYIDGAFRNVLRPMFANIESVSASFNYPSRAISIGRYNVADPDAKNRTDSSLIYSGVFQSGELNYNDLNRFVNEPIYLDGIQGNITGLVAKRGTLEVYQEKKITPFYINRIVETLADGTSQSIYSTAFLNQGTPSMFNIGCSHTMSMATNVYATYFYDLLTSSWYRRSQDGLKNITFDDTPASGKMKNYGITLSKLISAAKDAGVSYYVRGAWDPVKQMYLFTYINPATTDDITIGFHEPTNSWLSFYTLYEEMYIGLNSNRLLSFNNGQIQEHHISANRVDSGYITVHFNKNPNMVKTFRAIEVGAEQKWVPSTDGDIYIESDALGYTDDDSYEFFYPRMTSSLAEGHFKGKEGSWTANFLRNTLTKLGTARAETSANLYLYKGELLKGKTISIKLRNTKTTTNKLKYLTLRHDKSK